ncbi:APC family permease [Kutzneria buriramensis]|uniref:Amino acid transporter n=1 Tax=Kutzneria buriramensis TaxID=1045776 RepID=A0A3E0HZ13_9PSEU|nr:APC family permease [Kutzneria buriramensis]REH51621.1 amino acid transporter [Kutzneria buriramensis]
MASPSNVAPSAGGTGHFKRTVGFYGLMFISLGSIIGSGWLLGALNAAKVAGPASLISWVLAAAMLAVLALIHAELGAAYPVAGGTARFPLFAFGRVAGFIAGWSSWIQAVAIAPIEVEASLAYLDNIPWVKDNLNLLNEDGTLTGSGFGWATLLMVIFTVVNIVGVKLLSESNTITVLWKTAVPLLTVVVLVPLSFHGANFSAGGGFMPFGLHGVFQALPLGVVFALQGFEQCIQLAAEAAQPKKDLSRAVLVAMGIGAIVYILLEIAFIGSLDPAALVKGWADPIAKGDFGPYATLAIAAGASWLAYILYVDAFVSPAGTGLIYVGTSARLTYALGRDKQIPSAFGKLNVRGVPLWSIILAFVIGEASFAPFPSWSQLVSVVTSATAVMYAFAPVSLAALRRQDPDRERPYLTPLPAILAPLGFVCANLIIYWSGWDVNYQIGYAIVAGLVVFAITRAFQKPETRSKLDLKAAQWIVPWFAGLILLGYLGRYNLDAKSPSLNLLPDGIDVLVVAAWSLIVFYWAVACARPTEEVVAAVEEEQFELANQPEINTA